ncbi:bifunctional glutamine-synthetase adenylyltransferase/deadenyltransferase [[Haemophilus] ducreyi]|nr:bifunctional glutamine-synthetase adenylyltransferase/deadenyltransferase [[Haemophilus] ducreyi]
MLIVIRKWRSWSDNVRIFTAAIECGILSQHVGEGLKNAYTHIRNRIHQLNLLQLPSIVNDTEFVSERAFVTKIWQQIFTDNE